MSLFISHSDIAAVQGSAPFFKKCVEKVQASKKCPVCTRGFDSQSDVDKVINTVSMYMICVLSICDQGIDYASVTCTFTCNTCLPTHTYTHVHTHTHAHANTYRRDYAGETSRATTEAKKITATETIH